MSGEKASPQHKNHQDNQPSPESLPDEQTTFSPAADLQLLRLRRDPKSILRLQRTIGNQAVQRLLTAPAPSLQRQVGSSRNIRITVATKLDDMIGHAWIIIERPVGGGVSVRETWGFYPVEFDMGAMLGPGEGVRGRLMHPDPHNADTPTTTYVGMTDEAGYQRAIAYAERQRNHRYHLLRYNCAAFANEMYAEATGELPPQAFAVIRTPYGTAAEGGVMDAGRTVAGAAESAGRAVEGAASEVYDQGRRFAEQIQNLF